MRPDDPNLPNLRAIAEVPGGLWENMVFVGSAVAGLLVRDPLADTVLAVAPGSSRSAVVSAFAGLLEHRDFANALPGLIAEPERIGIVLQRLKGMSQ